MRCPRRPLPVLSLLALGLTGAALAQPAEVRLHVLADTVAVGERFGVAVAVEHGPAVQVLFPEPPPDPRAAADAPLRAGEAELLAVRRLPPDVRGGTRVDSAVYAASVFTLDRAVVGPVRVRVVRGADTTTVASPPGRVAVRSLLPTDADEPPAPRGLAPLADFPRALWPWLAAAAALLALALGVWGWLRQRRRRIEAAAPPLPPYAQVRADLSRLAQELPEREADVKPFYVALSDALREYLARTLHIAAREQTTRELLAMLDRRPDAVPAEARHALLLVLTQADLAKFAAVVPAADSHRRALEQARAAVEQVEAAVHPPEPEAEPEEG
ncbi:MAG: hypothetical protein R3362_03495 [Rhodothermales bacterium]|nr:hypothetical protein [Rhodothermales bacterium]